MSSDRLCTNCSRKLNAKRNLDICIKCERKRAAAEEDEEPEEKVIEPEPERRPNFERKYDDDYDNQNYRPPSPEREPELEPEPKKKRGNKKQKKRYKSVEEDPNYIGPVKRSPPSACMKYINSFLWISSRAARDVYGKWMESKSKAAAERNSQQQFY